PMLEPAAITAIAVKPRVERDIGVGSAGQYPLPHPVRPAHWEVVLRAGVSHGTVCLVRQQLRAEMPLYRNTESGPSVPFACRLRAAKNKVREKRVLNPLKSLVGPAGFEPATKPL